MIRRFIPFLILFFLLSGCYLPTHFEADLNIDEKGRFAFRYKGDIISLSLLRKIGAEGLNREEIQEQAAIYKRDLARDPGFKKVEYLSRGQYEVYYEYQAEILKSKSFTFIRPNAMFLRLKKRDDGFIELQGNRPPKRYVDELISKGFDVRGVLRVWTSAKVVKHNAPQVQEGSPALYQWPIQSMRDPVPSIIMLLK